jgi:hypothetical protein
VKAPLAYLLPTATEDRHMPGDRCKGEADLEQITSVFAVSNCPRTMRNERRIIDFRRTSNHYDALADKSIGVIGTSIRLQLSWGALIRGRRPKSFSIKTLGTSSSFARPAISWIE